MLSLHLADPQMQGHLAGSPRLGPLQRLPPLLLEKHKARVPTRAAKGFCFHAGMELSSPFQAMRALTNRKGQE